MKFSKNDYIVVREANKNVLGIVTGPKNMTVVDGIEGDNVRSIKFDPKYDLMAVLGKSPENGAKVLGVTVKTFLESRVYDGFPNVHMFCDKSLAKNVDKAIKRVIKIIGKHKTREAVRRAHTIYVMQTSGAKTHAYRSSFKKEEWKDTLTVYVRPTSDVDEIVENMLLAFGESFYTHLISTERKTKWILGYHRMKNVRCVDHDSLTDVLEAFKQEGDVRDVKNILSDEVAEISDFVFKYVSRVTGVSTSELQTIAATDSDKLDALWPTEILIPNAREDIPKYAMSKVASLFAYAYMMAATKQNPGKTLTKLMKFTLKELV